MIEVRQATAEDYDAYARLMPELGTDDPIPDRARFVSDLAARTLIAVAPSDARAVVGYALVEQMQSVGYIRNVVADPVRRRTGVGSALMSAARDRFMRWGATEWCLNVKPSNVAAISLYERFGMRIAYRSTALRLPTDAMVPATDLALATIEPDHDAAIEATFGLLPGQLASARKKPGRRIVELTRGDEILGVAVFVASFPGAFPFRVVAPELAGAFAALLRSGLPPNATFCQLVVEDDDATTVALKALGAHVHMELAHMRGTL